MKKQILTIGNALNKAEQKEITGGKGVNPFLDNCMNGSEGNRCTSDANCCPGETCTGNYNRECVA